MPVPMTTTAQIAAYVGAAAWLPPIVLLIYHSVIKSKVTIVAEKQVEIGYTSYGAIFNLRLAISAARKGTIIDQVGVSIQHEDGSIYKFEWAGMKETFSQIKDVSGNTAQFVEREYSPIAIVLGRGGVIERFFRFQVPVFHSKLKEFVRLAMDYKVYLMTSKPDYHEDLLASKETHDVIEYYNQSFFWKSGRYTVTFSVKSPNKVFLTKSIYAFDLKSYEIDELKKNLPLIKIEATNLIKSDLEGFLPEKVTWHWASTSLERVEK